MHRVRGSGPLLESVGSVLLALCAASCAGHAFVAADARTPVESSPSGAEVFVMGERVGTTPLELDDSLAFPLSYPPERRALYGKVVLRHEGCEEWQAPLSVKAARYGIVAELDCEPGVTPVEGSDEGAAPPPSLEQRLRRLDDLREEGLVDGAEWTRVRGRILDDALRSRSPEEALRRIEELHRAGLLSDEERSGRRQAILDSL